MPSIILLFVLYVALASAKAVPANLSGFIQKIKNNGACNNPLPGSFYDKEGGSKSFRYCKGDGFIYLKGPKDKLANMDIDCDGIPNPTCPSEGTDTQSQTSFKDRLGASYGIRDLDASIHNYVVFGNSNDDNSEGYTSFNPEHYGIKPLSLMAVVCGNKLFYGVWGDQNGSDGPPLVGEASISLARLCFGNSMTNTNGHDQADVLYLAFDGNDAVPGPNGAAWKAKSATEFQANKKFNDLGDRLVQRVKA